MYACQVRPQKQLDKKTFKTVLLLIFQNHCIYCCLFSCFQCTPPPVRLRGPPEAERIRRRITHTHTHTHIFQPPRRSTHNAHTHRTQSVNYEGSLPVVAEPSPSQSLNPYSSFSLVQRKGPAEEIGSLSQSFFGRIR